MIRIKWFSKQKVTQQELLNRLNNIDEKLTAITIKTQQDALIIEKQRQEIELLKSMLPITQLY